MSFPIPVVFIIFRRPDVTARVFEEIRLAQPQKLFIIADGPRNETERHLCAAAREVTKDIDWPCDVIRDYSEENLGCRIRVVSGLNKVFEVVDSAIVLEDDCLPNQSFFYFCRTLLKHYRDDKRIWVISGNNFQDGRIRGDGSYYFSRYPHCWGWATWKRAWINYDDHLSHWLRLKSSGLLKSIFYHPDEIQYWTQIYDSLLKKGLPDSWSYRWTYTCWKNGALTVLPNANLVSNIGFGSDATNTTSTNKVLQEIQTQEMKEIKHPSFIIRDFDADYFTFKKVFFRPLPKGPMKIISLVRIHLGKLKRLILSKIR